MKVGLFSDILCLFSWIYYRRIMRTSEDRSGLLVTCTGNTGRSPVLTGELVPVDWHGLPVQVTIGPDRSSEVLIRMTLI